MAEEEEEYFLPLQDQRVFGAGIKRKRVAFVPSSSLNSSGSEQDRSATARSASDIYLSIVQKRQVGSPAANNDRPKATVEDNDTEDDLLCAVCRLPVHKIAGGSMAIKRAHESSIAHQVCLTPSTPPSHLDRNHVGVRYLANYGWDPGSRGGLGARAEGIRVPIKAKMKSDTAGIGSDVSKPMKAQKPVRRKLNAKEVNLEKARGRRKAAQLRDALYGKDLEQYLGPGG